MSDISTELAAVLADHAVRECITRVARGEDRRSAELLTASFWPDATIDFGIFVGTFPEYLEYVVPGSPAVILTQHFLGQTVVELDGDVALAETPVQAYHRVDYGTEHNDTTLGGRYLDRFEKRDGTWRIAQRTMLYDWVRNDGTSADWSQGLMGMSFSGDHFTGKTVDDFSVKFFGK